MAVTPIYSLRTFSDIVSAVMEELKYQSTDTVSKNRIKRDINMIYLNEVIPYEQWKWLRGHCTINHDARIATGTATVTQSSVTVTLTVAPATSKEGWCFSVEGQSEVYRIAAHVAGSTTVTLDVPYMSSTSSTATYKIWNYKLPLPVDLRDTVQVTMDTMSEPLEGQGIQQFRRHMTTNAKLESRPRFYCTSDYIDPTPYVAVAGLPAVSTSASDGLVKTLVFASTVASLLQVGDRIKVTGSAEYAFNVESTISSVSTTTITYTSPIALTQSATADAGLTLKKDANEKTAERFKELWVYPAVYNSRSMLHVDYTKEGQPLIEDEDEPLMPIGDRTVLLYGALMRAWSRERNPEEATRNQVLYERKLAKMAGKLDDSTDLPILRTGKTWLAAKRETTRRRAGDLYRYSGGTGGSASIPDILGTANTAAIYNASGVLQGSTAITTTELNYLDGLTSHAVGLSDTQTLTNKTIDADLNTITNIENADIKAGAAITVNKLAALTASRLLVTDGSGVITTSLSTNALNSVYVNVTEYGAVGDNATDNTTAITNAIAAVVAGGTGILYFPPGVYYCANNITVSTANVGFLGDGKASKIRLADGKKIAVTASGFTMDNLWVDGTLYTTHTATGRLLEVTGANCANYLTNISIRNCFFTNAPYYGIYAEFVRDLIIESNTVDTVSNAAITLFSCSDVVVKGNVVKNINLDGFNANAYGIAVTELAVNSGNSYTGTITNGSNQVTSISSVTALVVGQYISNANFPDGTFITNISGTTVTVSALATGSAAPGTIYFSQPPSERVTVVGNDVSENPVWEGIDSHSGRDIAIISNTVRNCKMAIVVGDSGLNFGMAPHNVTITGNTCVGYHAEDATKTVTGVGTAMTMSAAPHFTVKIGDYLIVAGEGRRITAVGSQTGYTIASAFTGDPTAAAAIVTQKGYSSLGIALTGSATGAPGTVRKYATGCVISSNVVAYHGTENDALSGGIYAHSTLSLAVNSNTVIEANHYGIFLYYDCQGTSVTGNTIVDPWSHTKTDAACIAYGQDYHRSTVTGNMFKRGSKTATYVLVSGIRFNSSFNTNCRISLGANFYDGSGNHILNFPTIETLPTGIIGAAGTAGAVSFGCGAVNLGIYQRSPNNLAIVAAGVEQIHWINGTTFDGSGAGHSYNYTGKSFQYNSAGTAGGQVFLFNNQADGSMVFSGGNNATNGAQLVCYGQSHASRPGAIELRNSGTVYQTFNLEVNAGAASGATPTINFTNGTQQRMTMTANATFTLSNPTVGTKYRLKLIQDATGGWTYTWPGTVLWAGGTAPTGSAANKIDIIDLYWDGTNYFGQFSLNY